MHTSEQHWEPMKHPYVPVWRQPHAALLHWLVQHCDAAKQNCPSATHAAAHLPLVQVLEQQSLFCVQVSPSTAQLGAPHWLATQLFEQHWPERKHCCPSVVHPGLAQTPS
jgi:hypothetical protein